MHKRRDRHRKARDSGTQSDSSVECRRRNRSTSEEDLSIIHPGNDRFRNALYYWTHRLADHTSRYNDEAAQSVAKMGQTSAGPGEIETTINLTTFLKLDFCQI